MPTMTRPRALIVLASVVAFSTVDAWTLLPAKPFIGLAVDTPRNLLIQPGVATVPVTDEAPKRNRAKLFNFVKDKLGVLRRPVPKLEPMTYQELEVQHLKVLRDLDAVQREREALVSERQSQLNQMNTWSGSVKELKAQVVSLEHELRTTRKQIEEVQSSKAQLERSLADAKKALDRKNPGLLKINNQILKELDEEKRAVAALRAREATLIRERDEAQAKMEKTLAKITRQFETEKKSMVARLEEMQAKQAMVLKMERELVSREAALNRDNEGLQALLERQRQRYTSNAEKLESDLKALRVKEQAYATLLVRHQELEEVSKRTKGQLGLVTSRLSLMEEDKQRLFGVMEESREQAEKALAELTAFRVEVEATRKLGQDMKRNWEAAEKEARVAEDKLREERVSHQARVNELRYQVNQAVRESREAVDKYTLMTREVEKKAKAGQEAIWISLHANQRIQELILDAGKEYENGVAKIEAAETNKLQHLSKRHAEEVKKLMVERGDAMRLLVEAHDENIHLVTEKLRGDHAKELEEMRVVLMSHQANEKKLAAELSDVTAQAERVQAQYVADKQRWEEQMEAAQQSAMQMRTRMEEEKAQLIQVMQSDRKRMEDERDALKREIKVMKRLEAYVNDPFQLIMFAFRRMMAMEEEFAQTT